VDSQVADQSSGVLPVERGHEASGGRDGLGPSWQESVEEEVVVGYEATRDLLTAALGAAVPLTIKDFEVQLEYGRLTVDDLTREAPELGQFIAEHGDNILYRSKKKGETAEAFNKLVRAIAILAIIAGEVKIFGQTFRSNRRSLG
jgi:hypothetical protein